MEFPVDKYFYDVSRRIVREGLVPQPISKAKHINFVTMEGKIIEPFHLLSDFTEGTDELSVSIIVTPWVSGTLDVSPDNEWLDAVRGNAIDLGRPDLNFVGVEYRVYGVLLHFRYSEINFNALDVARAAFIEALRAHLIERNLPSAIILR
jgi:hypothetical protein